LTITVTGGHSPYYFTSNKKLFVRKDAFVAVLASTLGNNKRRARNLTLIQKVPVTSFKEGEFLLWQDVPQSIIQSLKLSEVNILRALKVYDLELQNKKVSKRDLIYTIISNSIEENWIQYLPRYSEYQSDRSISYSRLHALLNEYLTLPYSIKDIYTASKSLFCEQENWNYNYLTEKLKRIRTGESSIENELKPKKGKVRNLKFTRELKDKAEAEYEKEFSSYDDILIEVNLSARKLGLREITKSTLKSHLKLKEVQNRLRLKRNGDQWYKANIEAPIHLNKPELKDELYEADGSRIQIPYYNRELNEVDFLSVFVILDVATGNVVGYSCDQYENHEMVLMAFERLLVINGRMPRCITTDKARHYKAKRFKDFKSESKRMGVTWRETSNPSGKPYVESFFRLFGQKISKSSPGYYGLGITCMNPDSRSEKRRIAKILKMKSTLFSREELIIHVDSLIEYYRTTPRGDSLISPAELYKLQKKSGGIATSDLDLIKLTWKSKIVTVSKSEITIKRSRKFYYFQLSHENGLAYSRSKIKVYFKDNLEEVYCFDEKGNFVEQVKAFKRINPSPAISCENDKKILNKLLAERIKRKNNTINDSINRKKRIKENESKIIPIDLRKTVTNNKSEEYEVHKEFTRQLLDPKNGKRVSIRSIESTLELNIDTSRLYKKIDP